MNFEEFRHALTVLATLSMQDLVDANAIDDCDNAAWTEFQADPLKWILRADNRCSQALWQAMSHRARMLPLPLGTIDRQLRPLSANVVQLSSRTLATRP